MDGYQLDRIIHAAFAVIFVCIAIGCVAGIIALMAAGMSSCSA